jgi:V/A-type H+-transporting ATPase subunit C
MVLTFNDTQYAYASARIRAVERNLLDSSKIDRMVDSNNADEAYKILLESGYGLASTEAAEPYEYEILLRDEMKKTYKFLNEVAPQPEIFDLFLQRNDYHNIKVILKSEFLNQEDDEEILMDIGSISVSKLKVMIKDRNFSGIPGIMRKAIIECIDTFNRTSDPQIIDIILDRANYEQMMITAQKSGIKFVKELVQIYIDMANIKNFLRLKKMNKSWDFASKILLKNGRIDLKTYLEKMESPVESFIEMLANTPYGSFVEEGLNSFISKGSITKLEKLTDDYIISFVKKSKLVFFGIEPLIAFLIAKENEIKIARIIMVGKINKIPNEIIRERLREAYV